MDLNDFSSMQYINLVTYKRDESSVTTPVWIVGNDKALYVTTGKNAGNRATRELHS